MLSTTSCWPVGNQILCPLAVIIIIVIIIIIIIVIIVRQALRGASTQRYRNTLQSQSVTCVVCVKKSLRRDDIVSST